jgi:hypothetical protein
MFQQRAEARLDFARNLPPEDPKRDLKIREAERALQTALASKIRPAGSVAGPKAGKGRKKRAR